MMRSLLISNSWKRLTLKKIKKLILNQIQKLILNQIQKLILNQIQKLILNQIQKEICKLAFRSFSQVQLDGILVHAGMAFFAHVDEAKSQLTIPSGRDHLLTGPLQAASKDGNRADARHRIFEP